MNYIFPLITIPYLIRTLGENNFGSIAIVQIVISYISLVVDYGFNLSATKDISLNRKKKHKVNSIFSNVVYIKVSLAVICVTVTCTILTLTSFPNSVLYLIGLIHLIGQILFPLWFYQGIERMGIITVFNTFSKIGATLLIFKFTKGASDTALTIFFYSICSALAGLMAFFYALGKYKITLVRPNFYEIKTYLRTGFDVFLPGLFANIINNGGLLVLGIYYPSSVVGIYSAIDKIIRAGIGVLSAVTQSIFPEISRKLAEDKASAIKYIIRIGKRIFTFIIISVLILSFCSNYVLSAIYTPSYVQYSYIFNWLLLWTVIGFLNNFIGIQFLVGSGNSSYYRRSFTATSVYILLTFPTIIYASIDGVLFSVITGELFLTGMMVYYIRRKQLLRY